MNLLLDDFKTDNQKQFLILIVGLRDVNRSTMQNDKMANEHTTTSGIRHAPHKPQNDSTDDNTPTIMIRLMVDLESKIDLYKRM